MARLTDFHRQQQGVAAKTLYWVLLRVILGDPQMLEFL
jgi:hypothetical protein